MNVISLENTVWMKKLINFKNVFNEQKSKY